MTYCTFNTIRKPMTTYSTLVSALVLLFCELCYVVLWLGWYSNTKPGEPRCLHHWQCPSTITSACQLHHATHWLRRQAPNVAFRLTQVQRFQCILGSSASQTDGRPQCDAATDSFKSLVSTLCISYSTMGSHFHLAVVPTVNADACRGGAGTG